MYAGVPITIPVRVIEAPGCSPVASFAIPKSRILVRSPFAMSGSRTMKMLSGLRSRWTMPLACAAPSAPAICRPSAVARVAGNGPVRRRRADRLSPSRYSITM
jgi:hypothetical protein